MKKWIINILHVGYWFLYTLLISFFLLLIAAASGTAQQQFMTRHFLLFVLAFAFIPAVISFYIFYKILFRKYLKPRKIRALFLSGILAALFSGAIATAIIPLVSPIMLSTDHYSVAIFMMSATALIGLLNGGMGLLLNGFVTWYDEIRLKEELNRKNHEMELALVKSNISPHFLFNTLNNIDTLISLDAERASSYLNKLSDIMRFMLYETKTEKIPLSDEISYIEKYIELQKIRTSNTEYIQYRLEGDPKHAMIEPLLFIPFIENAFKHADHKKTGTAITLNIFINPSKIWLQCRNSYPVGPTYKSEYGGLGNELIRRRLELLYPGKHSLKVDDDNGWYSVELELPLQEGKELR